MRETLTTILISGAAILARHARRRCRWPAQPAPSPAAVLRQPQLRRGQHGSLRHLDSAGRERGQLQRQPVCPITVDGTYGPATRAAVAKFQAGCNTIEDFHAGSAGYISGGVVRSNTCTALITHCYVPPA
jgi:hypothetical protein